MSAKKKQTTSQPMSFKTLGYQNSHSGKCILGISFADNPEQRELIRLMNENSKPIIFCTGDAGTGKTFTALAAAIDLVKVQKKFSNIIYIREPIEVGKNLGYLPGTVDEKLSVYLDGMVDNLKAISEYSGININELKATIEGVAPQYCRGRTWTNSIILVDECQNCSLEQIHMLCTRLGKFSKIVLLGSMNQIDVKGKTRDDNDFLTSYEILKDFEDIVSRVDLVKSERSEYCKILDEAFTNYKLTLSK